MINNFEATGENTKKNRIHDDIIYLKHHSVEGNGVLSVTLDPEAQTPLHVVQQPQLRILSRDEGFMGLVALKGT